MNPTPLRIIFAGTPEFSVAPLQALLDSPHEVIAVYTQPDRPAGRGRKLTASPVKELAQQHNLTVYQPATLRDADVQAELAALNADLMVVVAYGLILPKVVLDLPKHGCFNIHASILPRWRGAAPIQRAIEAGDPETGVTIMQMDVGLDTGDMLSMLTTEITPQDTAQTLHDRLSTLGCTALLKTIEELQAGQLKPIKQDEELTTYAEKMSKEEGLIDWNLDAQTLVRKIHAFNPWPVSFCHYQQQPLRIWQAEVVENTSNNAQKLPGRVIFVDKNGIEVTCGQGTIRLLSVQPTGKKAMPAYDFAQARALVDEVLI